VLRVRRSFPIPAAFSRNEQSECNSVGHSACALVEGMGKLRRTRSTPKSAPVVRSTLILYFRAAMKLQILARIRLFALALCWLLAAASAACLKTTTPPLPKIFPEKFAPKGKPPIILIPGILGSELVNPKTNQKVWPDVFPKDRDALMLPIASDDLRQNRDELVAARVMENAELGALIPQIGVYAGLLEALEKYAGYQRGELDVPPADGYQDRFYLFAYDWRRDNVESAQKLAATLARLRAQWNKSDLRFDIIGHSMGGLIARYYAMYGARDLSDNPQSDWAGARHINRLILMGTPNAGSFDAFRTIQQGYSVTAADRATLRLFGGTHRRMIFTVPAVYQLLPRSEGARFYDEKLQRLPIDLYDAETWRARAWSAAYSPEVMNDERKSFIKKLGATAGAKATGELNERRAQYLKVVLARAQAFHRALDAESTPPQHLSLHLMGGDCETTIAGAFLVNDKGKPQTLFWPNGLFGNRKQRRAARDLIFLPGDGRVIRQSLFGLSALEPLAQPMKLAPQQTLFYCEVHGDLPLNQVIQNNLLTVLLGYRY
jgi:pimeloyl-ACP methyl ester carboxylesterase